MDESAFRSVAVMAALCAAGCTVLGGAGLDEARDEAPGEAGAAPFDSLLAGRFAPLAGYSGVGGRAQLARQLDGATRIDVQLTGVPAGLAMTAHVHAAPCAFQGGGHYKIDPAVLDTVEANELWLHLTSSAEGIATISALFPHLARGDALSIVLHDPASGGKMACADLSDGATEFEADGWFAPFAQAEEIDQWIGGAAAVVRSGDQTAVYLAIDGLDPAQAYAAHVHALPCAVLDGGGHYKIDPTVTDTVADNEIWPDLSGAEDGSVWSETDFAHGVRADAQSIVLHRVAADSKPKVACADLTRFDAGPLVAEGDAVLLPAGAERAPDLWATATMVRTLAGTTEVWLYAEGLAAGASYPVHVHDLPCPLKDGGGHYLIDPAAGAGEGNEMWLPMTAGGGGAAWAESAVPHLARAEAQSIVIHDGADNARLACIDLE